MAATNKIHVCQCSTKLFFIHKIKDSVNAQPGLNGPLPDLPKIEKTNTADTADTVGDHIQNIGMPERNKILVDLIADAINDRRGDADQNQPVFGVFERQGCISSEEQDSQQAVSYNMQEFIKKLNIRDAFRAGPRGLDVNSQAVNDQRQPANEKISKF